MVMIRDSPPPEISLTRSISANRRTNGSKFKTNKESKLSAFQQKQQNVLDRLLDESKVDWDQVRGYLFMEGLDPNLTDCWTLVQTVHRCAYDGEADILRWCLSLPSGDVNARTSLGRSVLHFACDGNQVGCIRVLLQSGADVNIRTLSGLTPLHLCCSYSSFDAALVLLHESPQIVDIDAENTKRMIPESIARDKRIVRAIKKYRAVFDEKRKAALVEQALKRLFHLFDRRGDDCIHPEEWAESQYLLAQHFACHNDEAMEDAFDNADLNNDGVISWEEFKETHVMMLESVSVSYRELMFHLVDLENAFFEQKVKIEQAMEEECAQMPLMTPRGKAMALKRATSKVLMGAVEEGTV